MSDRPLFLRGAVAWAGLHGTAAVLLGAFAAHGMTDPQAIAWVETASRYQLAHAVALLALGVAAPDAARRWLGVAAAAFAVGPLLFSGALYGLALTDLRGLGALAPIGGAVLILGWLAVIGAGVTLRRAR